MASVSATTISSTILPPRSTHSMVAEFEASIDGRVTKSLSISIRFRGATVNSLSVNINFAFATVSPKVISSETVSIDVCVVSGDSTPCPACLDKFLSCTSSP